MLRNKRRVRSSAVSLLYSVFECQRQRNDNLTKRELINFRLGPNTLVGLIIAEVVFG